MDQTTIQTVELKLPLNPQPNKPKSPPPPSDLFLEHVRSASSIVIECELCGRVHFGDGSGDYEEGELEGLLEQAKEEPEKYIQHMDNDMVSYGYIVGKQAVLDCPCNGLRRYENFILSHKMLIMKYLTDYAQDKYRKINTVFQAAQAAKKAMALMEEEELKAPTTGDNFTRKFDLD